ncbi:hypothetical protein [Candidatus Lokiarchaeum ossiferum]|uniref:hypothetical protein n=1 Tax=Candidatus Lokiarchaeum ossiferum TaxID=2951803 RepID=UPI00352C0FAB
MGSSRFRLYIGFAVMKDRIAYDELCCTAFALSKIWVNFGLHRVKSSHCANSKLHPFSAGLWGDCGSDRKYYDPLRCQNISNYP